MNISGTYWSHLTKPVDHLIQRVPTSSNIAKEFKFANLDNLVGIVGCLEPFLGVTVSDNVNEVVAPFTRGSDRANDAATQCNGVTTPCFVRGLGNWIPGSRCCIELGLVFRICQVSKTFSGMIDTNIDNVGKTEDVVVFVVERNIACFQKVF